MGQVSVFVGRLLCTMVIKARAGIVFMHCKVLSLRQHEELVAAVGLSSLLGLLAHLPCVRSCCAWYTAIHELHINFCHATCGMSYAAPYTLNLPKTPKTLDVPGHCKLTCQLPTPLALIHHRQACK
jgi:hypothetical protein